MDSGSYAACAGLVAKTRELDVAAHNLANVSTSGFKGQQLSFQSVLAQSGRSMGQLNRAINEFGFATSPQIDASAGALDHTGNQLDLAVEGSGYFVVKTAAGPAYTRDGHFELSSTRQLVTADGLPVLGDQGPITIPSGVDIQIGADGTISVDGALAGKLSIVELPSTAALTETAPGRFLSDKPSAPATNSNVRQGWLENANVDPVTQAVGLVALQRHADMLQRAMSMFYSEFDRTANDLAKV